MPRLLFRDSQGREGTVELSPAETVYVGRGLECAIRTDDGMVSRRHSQIRLENGRFVVEDLGSANGTLLNNVRIQKQAIGHADVIQCGSLVIRFVDEGGVHVVPQAVPQGAAPPGKHGGTMVLDRGPGAPPLAQAPGASPYGAPPAMPVGGPPSMPAVPPGPPAMPANPLPGPSALPYGGPPSMPSGHPFGGGGSRSGFGGSAGAAGHSQIGLSPPALPYGGPPGMPASGPAPVAASPVTGPPAPGTMPFGGPSGMTGQGGPVTRAEPSMFGRGSPASGSVSAQIPAQAPPPGPRTAAQLAENKVLVDLGLEFDQGKAEAEIKRLRADAERSAATLEREIADGKRVRAESATLRDRVDELRAQVKDREDQVAAHDRVADELRDELQQTRNDLARLRGELGEMAETVAARERQAARALEDTAKVREDMDDLNRQLMELSRIKDEGWKKLNEQLSEIDHLREVINEQERMLEERRIGLMSQEEVIKQLRAEKENHLKSIAQLKAERDEAARQASRSSAQIVGLEEENRRLGRLLVESQTDMGRAGSQPDHLLKLQGDLKDLRVELKKAEADRDRFHEQFELADRDRMKFEGRLGVLEVELQEAIHGKLAAESARNVAQDALAKAEVARHKAAEEALIAAKARDQATSGGDDARREADRLRRKIGDLEKLQGGAVTIDPRDVQREREGFERKLEDANARAAETERSVKALQAEVEAAKTDAAKARAEAARVKASSDARSEEIIEAAGSTVSKTEITRLAGEVYEAINDILSEMRNNMVLVQGELPNLAADAETMQAVTDAVEALVNGAETAKGALRGLRDLAESK